MANVYISSPESTPTATPASSVGPKASQVDFEFESEDEDGAPIRRISSAQILEMDLNKRLKELSPLSPQENIDDEAEILKSSFDALSRDATLSEAKKQLKIINLFSDTVKKLETKRKTPDGSCVSRSVNLSNSERKPLVTITGEAEMLNYHYIWFINDEVRYNDLSEKTNIDILDHILKYSFLMCNIFHTTLTTEEKSSIINDEYTFIKNKVTSIYPTIKFIQIPRLLYDLFTIDNIRAHEMQTLFNLINIDKNDYRNLVRSIIRKINLNEAQICFLNKEIVGSIISRIGFRSLIQLEDKNKRRDLFIQLFLSFFSNLDLTLLKRNLLFSLKERTFIEQVNEHFIDEDFNLDRFKTILYQSYLLDMGYMYQPHSDEYINNQDKDKFILIRGDYGSWDAIWANKPVRRAHSSSFNTALMNAIYSDKTAATLNYWTPSCNKKYYVIKKFIYGDDSDEDKIFFVPPMHPLLLLFSYGEFWHARTKVGNNYPVGPGVGGIYYDDHIKWGTIRKPLPDFLVSKFTMDEIEAKYVGNYVDIPWNNHVVHSEYNKYLNYKSKYLKYKNKYLQLKNKLNI